MSICAVLRRKLKASNFVILVVSRAVFESDLIRSVLSICCLPNDPLASSISTIQCLFVAVAVITIILNKLIGSLRSDSKHDVRVLFDGHVVLRTVRWIVCECTCPSCSDDYQYSLITRPWQLYPAKSYIVVNEHNSKTPLTLLDAHKFTKLKFLSATIQIMLLKSSR